MAENKLDFNIRASHWENGTIELNMGTDSAVICKSIPKEKWMENNLDSELTKAGIYILSSSNSGNIYELENKLPKIYIGQTDVVNVRIDTHLKKKNFWDKVTVFVASDKINSAYAKWLEYALIREAIVANRCQLENVVKNPTEPNLSRSDKAEMEKVLETIIIYLDHLNMNFFRLTSQDSIHTQIAGDISVSKNTNILKHSNKIHIASHENEPFRNYFNDKLSNESLSELKRKPATYWTELGNKMALTLFKYANTNIPAYREFIKSNKIDCELVNSIEKFKYLPLLDKQTYLLKNDFIKLYPNGQISSAATIFKSSGSGNDPFYFQRGVVYDENFEHITEVYLKNQFEIDNKSTLVISCLSMGIYLGGMSTYTIYHNISIKGYPLMSIAPIGMNYKESIEIIKQIGNHFDQIILIGYSPHIKELIDEGKLNDISWKKYNVKIVMAGESISEVFRNFLEKNAVNKSLLDTINLYTNAEFNIIAHETPLTNLIMKLATKNNSLKNMLFPGELNTSFLGQYYPQIVYLEEINGEIVASGFGSATPLVRYRTFDKGGIIPFELMENKLKDVGVDIMLEAKKQKIDQTIIKLPFVYIYDRLDFNMKLYGIIIYPETIRKALKDSLISKKITGKFSLQIEYDKKYNQRLEINIELKKEVKTESKLCKEVENIVIKYLQGVNAEFRVMYKEFPRKVTPIIKLWPFEDSYLFRVGEKQVWKKL